jgi:hypothetical protein
MIKKALIFTFPLHKVFILAGTHKGYINSSARRPTLRRPLTEPAQTLKRCLSIKMAYPKLYIASDLHISV